jgi:antitoxin MazE
MKVKVAKWGNSLGVRLPKAAADAAGLTAGVELDVTVEGSDLRLKKPARIPYHRLADLVAEMDRLGPENEPETVQWGPDRGAEIIDDAYSRGEITPDRSVNPVIATKRPLPLRRGKQNAPTKRR